MIIRLLLFKGGKFVLRGKKVLILGNGFDLAHNLPTRYGDFLDRCGIAYYFYEREQMDQQLFYYLQNNIWYDYFQAIYVNKRIRGETWINFESEISFIIYFIDRFSKNLLETCEDLSKELNNKENEDFDKLVRFGKALQNSYVHSTKTIKYVRKKCFDDLERLTKALEMYLFDVVENKEIKKLDIIKDINPDYIINFNYTHTYERLYSDKEEVFHIHGECIEGDINNMVLGIDEYWSEEECDQHTNYAIFKKFVQRIRKKTGTKHIKWLNEINDIYQTEKLMSDIYIFGHSLDITDKDILQGFFTSEATRIHIYCKDKETEGELIANVIKLMGEKNLLQKVNQIPPKIEFIVP